MERRTQQHNVPPVYDGRAKVLILGSFPSVKSRQAEFFYAHPRNRFWRVMAAVLEEPVPQTVEEKKDMLLRHGIALWDVIASCDVTGSSDASITNATANDLDRIFEQAQIRAVFCNGSAAAKYYAALQYPRVGRTAVALPSTSPANAQYSLERLAACWREAIAPWLNP